MVNGFSGLSIGKTSIQAHQAALEATSQNLSNANTEGYARKVVTMSSRASINLPDTQGPAFSSQVGTGVQIEKIEAVRDLILNQRIRDLNSNFEESNRQREVMDQLEALFVGEIDMAQSLDDFFSSLHDLATAPESLTVRSVVRARAVELTDTIRNAAEGLEEIQANLSREIESAVTKVNSITSELASLNEKVGAMVSAGLSPNDFEDRRQVLLERLSEYGNVQTVPGQVSQLNVLLGGQMVVQNFKSFDVRVQDSGPEQTPVLAVGPRSNEALNPTTGVLKGLQDLREGTIDRLRGDLNELAVSLTTTFNEIHSTGFGLDGSTGVDFFTLGNPERGETEPFSVKSTVFVERTDIPLDGDSSTTAPENFETNPIGLGQVTINGHGISYNGGQDSLQDIADRISQSGANVTATITPENRLVISATRATDFEIESMSDSGALLERLGIMPSSTAYPPPANVVPRTSIFTGDVELRPRDDSALRFKVTNAIRSDLNKIAAASGEDISSPPDGIGDRSRGPGDGANALELANLREGQFMTRGTATVNDFVVSMIGELGVESGAARRRANGLEAQIEQLEQRRQEIQGVSIDEELINMIKYQRGFEAAARIISTMDEVLQTILTLGR